MNSSNHAGGPSGRAPEVWVAERFWPGCSPTAAASACDALRRSCSALADPPPIGFLGGTLLTDDETLVTRFRGPRSAVVAVHELAHVPYDRLSRGLEM